MAVTSEPVEVFKTSRRLLSVHSRDQRMWKLCGWFAADGVITVTRRKPMGPDAGAPPVRAALDCSLQTHFAI